jgi:CheY-like chemotaxis protein
MALAVAHEKVLLVDDSKDFVKVAVYAFEDYGFKVTPATSSEEALKQVNDDGFMAAILDLNLPDKDGVDLAKEIGQKEPALPIFFLTGVNNPQPYKKKAKEKGVIPREWLLKPIPAAESELAALMNRIREGMWKARFEALTTQWRSRTRFSSSLSEISMDSAYQQLIGMGIVAVPFIIQELREKPDNWFWALKAITGSDPVPEIDRGNIAKMRDYWLEWADKNL